MNFSADNTRKALKYQTALCRSHHTAGRLAWPIMPTESEALLRSAARVAGEENAAKAAAAGEDATQVVVIHVVIKGVGEWMLDTLGDLSQASPQQTARAKLHLTYASADVFIGLAHRCVLRYRIVSRVSMVLMYRYRYSSTGSTKYIHTFLSQAKPVKYILLVHKHTLGWLRHDASSRWKG